MEICANAINRYESVVRNMLLRIGGNKLASSVNREDLLYVRKDMLSGGSVKNGLSVATANYYMTTMAGMFQFAADNGYIRENPFNGIRPLKRAG